MFRKIKTLLRNYLHLTLLLAAALSAAGLSFADFKPYSNLILIVAAVSSLVPLGINIYDRWRHGSYGVDLLAVTAIFAALALKEYWAALAVAVAMALDIVIEEHANKRARKNLSEITQRMPQTVQLVKGNHTFEVKLSQVKRNDKLRLLPGEIVPVDAEMVTGKASFDETALDAQSQSVKKVPGDIVISGSVNLDGTITVKALTDSSGSRYQQIIRMARAASGGHAPIVRLSDRYSSVFMAISLMLAATAWIFTSEPARFLHVLVVATPWALITGPRAAILAGLSEASRNGIFIKNGSAIEVLAQIKTMAFSKTAVLTTGEMSISGVKTYNGFRKDEVMLLAASLEVGLDHPIARSIAEYGSKSGKLAAPKQVKILTGLGVSGRVKNKSVIVGRKSFLRQQGTDLGDINESSTKTLAYVAVANKLAAVISFNDSVRTETKPVINKLLKKGVKNIAVITGDSMAVAKELSKIGKIQVTADCLAGDKIHAIENIKERPLAFVGHAPYDSPVMTASDVSIAIDAVQSRSPAAADVMIMRPNINKVAGSYIIAKSAIARAKGAAFTGIAASLVLMGLFAAIQINPTYGAGARALLHAIVAMFALKTGSTAK